VVEQNPGPLEIDEDILDFASPAGAAAWMSSERGAANEDAVAVQNGVTYGTPPRPLGGATDAFLEMSQNPSVGQESGGWVAAHIGTTVHEVHVLGGRDVSDSVVIAIAMKAVSKQEKQCPT
jgi:hypothetical protein